MTIQEQVISIMQQIKPTKDLVDVTDIIEGGYLDSFELMSLIAQLSDDFGIEIDVDEIMPENFNSIDAITTMVERLKG